ncbi:MAG: hypothetical protein JOZ08_19020 [Verrucomicrobia bacterium]|nr:hypothetical protein [Verrucomicrobiota bacterium]
MKLSNCIKNTNPLFAAAVVTLTLFGSLFHNETHSGNKNHPVSLTEQTTTDTSSSSRDYRWFY